MLDAEHNVAWGVVPLMTLYGDINSGTHNIPLYQIPVPDAVDIPVAVSTPYPCCREYAGRFFCIFPHIFSF